MREIIGFDSLLVSRDLLRESERVFAYPMVHVAAPAHPMCEAIFPFT